MAYNILDVLDKQIDYHKHLILNLEETLEKKYNIERDRTILKILINESERQIRKIKNKKSNLKEIYLEEVLEVNFLAYDKYSKDFIVFKNTFHKKKYKNKKEIFEYLIETEEKNYSILIGFKDKMYDLDKECSKEVHLEIDNIIDDVFKRIISLKKYVL